MTGAVCHASAFDNSCATHTHANCDGVGFWDSEFELDLRADLTACDGRNNGISQLYVLFRLQSYK